MSLRLVQCSEYPGGGAAMAFEFSYERDFPAGPPNYYGEVIASGDVDAEAYTGLGSPIDYLKGGVTLNRRMRPGWWALDYEYSNSDEGSFSIVWSLFDAALLGDAANGGETVAAAAGSYPETPYVGGGGSGGFITKVGSDAHPCAQILFALATIGMGYSAIYGSPSITITGTWLACASCAEPV